MEFRLSNATIKFNEEDLNKIYVEITNGCNLSCKMCYRNFWEDSIGFMKKDLFYNLMNQLREFNSLKIFHFGGIGEPLVHPDFLEFLEMAKRNYVTYISTNGTLLNEKISKKIVDLSVDRIIFSLDSPEEQGFKEIRGISNNIIYKNIKRIVEMKKEKRSDLPELEIEFVAMKSNIKDLPGIADIANDLGVAKIMVSNLLPMSEEQANEIVYDGKTDYEKYVNDFLMKSMGNRIMTILPEFKLRTERVCDFMEKKSTVISWDGSVVPCYRFLHSYPEFIFGRKKMVKKYSFGNIYDKKLFEIWNSDEYMKFRFMVSMSLYPSCIDCVFADKKCQFVLSTDLDCEGNSPSCGDCLWSRRIVLCP
ncbi:MAG: tungsten cofactor oxidoreductase radical SAM maturase [Thermoplasmata archaeon]|nr:tungsten cofactor oxidoreductase radical SAM maturase [Thermoplasmata archaeon]